MSLADKNKLFGAKKVPGAGGAGGGGGASSAAASSASASASAAPQQPAKPVSKTAGMNVAAMMGGASTGISATAKAKHIADAADCIASAEKALKTSVFQWSPDYVSAAPMYERASSCYRTAEDFENARKMMVKCADCHDSGGAYSGAACAIAKAAEIAATNQGNHSEAMTLYLRGSDLWGLAGEVQKHGDFVLKAAVEASKGGDPTAATPLYRRAAKLMLPPSSVDDPSRLRSLHPSVGEGLKTIFAYFLGRDDASLLPDLVSLGANMLKMYEAQEMEASANKMRSVNVLLQLEGGDVVAADKLFVEYLGVNAYLKSIDCRITEEYLISFKFHDNDRLEAAVKSGDNFVFDKEVQALCRRLTFMRAGKSGGGAAAAAGAGAGAAVSDAGKQALFGKKKAAAPAPVPAPVPAAADEDADEALGAAADSAAQELADLDIAGGDDIGEGGQGDLGGSESAAAAPEPAAAPAVDEPKEVEEDEDEIDLT